MLCPPAPHRERRPGNVRSRVSAAGVRSRRAEPGSAVA
jgi:hypothetical protein